MDTLPLPRATPLPDLSPEAAADLPFEHALRTFGEIRDQYLNGFDGLVGMKLDYYAAVIRTSLGDHPTVRGVVEHPQEASLEAFIAARALMTRALRSIFTTFLALRAAHPRDVGDASFLRALLLTSEIEEHLLALATFAVQYELLDHILEGEFRPYINPRPSNDAL